jgi:N utilization substance protein B
MGNRRLAREMAMQALFFIDNTPGDPEGALELFCRNFSPPERVRAFFQELVGGVLGARAAIDAVIERFSQHWKLDRMSGVDRNLLRLAVYEMFWRTDIPAKVSINEAIDIGKKFGTEDSGAFINGILDGIRIARDNGELVLAGAPAPPPPAEPAP